MARTAEPSDLATPASCTGQGDQIGTTGGATTWGPADTTALTTARPASAESEVRPGPRPPTLRAHRAEARQAEPDALATASLPTMRAPRSEKCGAIVRDMCGQAMWPAARVLSSWRRCCCVV